MGTTEFKERGDTISAPQLSENAKSEHFPTFSNGTHCIFMYIHGIYVKNLKKEFEFFLDRLGFELGSPKGSPICDLREILLWQSMHSDQFHSK